MKLIDLIVKEVKREDIPKEGRFFAQDPDDCSLWAFTDYPTFNYRDDGGFWSMGDDAEPYSEIDMSIKLEQLSSGASDVVVKIKDLMAAYDAAEKKANEMVETENLVDDVNHPSHYNNGGIECIDIIAEMVSDKQGMEAACVANVVKYLYRYKNKGGIESVKKAQWYLNKMIEGMESGKL